MEKWEEAQASTDEAVMGVRERLAAMPSAEEMKRLKASAGQEAADKSAEAWHKAWQGRLEYSKRVAEYICFLARTTGLVAGKEVTGAPSYIVTAAAAAAAACETAVGAAPSTPGRSHCWQAL